MSRPAGDGKATAIEWHTQEWAEGPRGLMDPQSSSRGHYKASDLQLQKSQDLSWHTRPPHNMPGPGPNGPSLCPGKGTLPRQQSNRTPYPAHSFTSRKPCFILAPSMAMCAKSGAGAEETSLWPEP